MAWKYDRPTNGFLHLPSNLSFIIRDMLMVVQVAQLLFSVRVRPCLSVVNKNLLFFLFLDITPRFPLLFNP